MRRFPISTPAVTALLVFVAALVWGRAFRLVPLVAGRFWRGGIPDHWPTCDARRQPLAHREPGECSSGLTTLMEATRTTVAEAITPVVEAQTKAWRRLTTQLNEIQSLQERTLEASDPSYERPNVLSLSATIEAGNVEMRASLQVVTLTRWELSTLPSSACAQVDLGHT